MVSVGIGDLVEIVTDLPTVALVTVLVLLVITKPPSMEAVVVIKLDPILVGVMVDPHVNIPIVLGLLDAAVHLLAVAVVVVVVVVGPVLVADPADEEGAPVAVVAVVPSFVLATVVLSWPLLTVLSRNFVYLSLDCGELYHKAVFTGFPLIPFSLHRLILL